MRLCWRYRDTYLPPGQMVGFLKRHIGNQTRNNVAELTNIDARTTAEQTSEHTGLSFRLISNQRWIIEVF